jgi:hypothetical protein
VQQTNPRDYCTIVVVVGGTAQRSAAAGSHLGTYQEKDIIQYRLGLLDTSQQAGMFLGQAFYRAWLTGLEISWTNVSLVQDRQRRYNISTTYQQKKPSYNETKLQRHGNIWYSQTTTNILAEEGRLDYFLPARVHARQDGSRSGQVWIFLARCNCVSCALWGFRPLVSGVVSSSSRAGEQ